MTSTPKTATPCSTVSRTPPGDTLAEIIIGNSRLGRADPQSNEYFVREPAMAQTWLVQGKLPDAIGVIEWLDSSVLKIDRERVRQVRCAIPTAPW